MFSSVISKVLLVVLSTTCVANAFNLPGRPVPRPGPQQPFPGDNSRPPRPGNPNRPGPGYEVKRVYIGRAVYNERLPLRQLAGLNSSYNGYEVISVRARTRPNSPATTVVQLIADGRVIASQTNPGYQIQLYPNFRAELGIGIRTLQLAVSGSTFIDDLEIEVAPRRGGGGPRPPHDPPYNPPQPPPYQPPQPPHNPPPPPYNPPGYGQQRVEISINRAMYGNDRIDLSQHVNLAQYRGLSIQEVIVTGGAEYQTSFVNLLINNFNYGQVAFSNYRQSQGIRLQRRLVIGHEAGNISLFTQGNMFVEQVILILTY
ncbi:MAG: hypothetical protein A2622_04405 [Bdellovibrionales bacterium RIFCSPHIGHO2_01_FULL_40_29]|nr:MAG: hypothetical protein A2622_04405 [Bdellovibrionales bacterium RIFCSPHIGHO2_01_FULL_40_29]OFZ34821.1 MAG: hypothetical protein A3D17_10970 [Bdellovibrionales bacterium RIFCSPHIGHO2_02_FULL_40_15]